jgi:hypothetical protein
MRWIRCEKRLFGAFFVPGNVKTINFQDRLGTNIEKVEGKGVFYRAL